MRRSLACLVLGAAALLGGCCKEPLDELYLSEDLLVELEKERVALGAPSLISVIRVSFEVYGRELERQQGLKEEDCVEPDDGGLRQVALCKHLQCGRADQACCESNLFPACDPGLACDAPPSRISTGRCREKTR